MYFDFRDTYGGLYYTPLPIRQLTGYWGSWAENVCYVDVGYHMNVNADIANAWSGSSMETVSRDFYLAPWPVGTLLASLAIYLDQGMLI